MSLAQDIGVDRQEALAGVGGINYLAVLDASHNAIVAADEQGRITYANPRTALTFGWAPADLIGQPVEVLLPERLAVRHVDHRAGFMRHPGARPMGIGLDLVGRRKDGSEFPAEISLSSVVTAVGVQVFATVVDISVRKSLEGQLLQAQKMESIGRLVGGIAHDFNNMLFAIGGYADLLVEDLEAGNLEVTGLRSSVEAIRNATDRAATLTMQLLAFSRRQALSPRVLDLNAVTTAIESMLRRLIGENVAFTLHLDPEPGRFRADPGQLDQILVNLVVNARDALPAEGGAIVIKTGNAIFDEAYAHEHFSVNPGSYIMLSVADNGTGMDAETREHAFEPFFTTKELGHGTGLGLATIYGIVHQAGGHIWLYSEPGHGTTFKIYFPRVDDETVPVAPTPTPTTIGHGRILVVEDEPTVRALTTLVLERGGYEVLVAGDAIEALACLEREHATIAGLISDVVMPGMSGPELVERVMSEYPTIGVVLVSGYAAETLGVAALQARGVAFLAKPFGRGDLLTVVERVIAASGDGSV